MAEVNIGAISYLALGLLKQVKETNEISVWVLVWD